MKPKTACLVLLLLATSINAWAGEPGSIYLRGSVGLATQSLGDVNDDIARVGSDLGEISSRIDWEEFGGAVPFGIEGGFQLDQRISWGIGFTYQKSNVEHFAVLDPGGTIFGDIGEDNDLSMLDLYGTVTLWIPQTPGLHFGGQLGIVRGNYDISDFVDLADGAGAFVVGAGSGDADATGLSLGIYAGYEAALSPGFALSGRLGYHYLNVGEMEGTYTFIGEDQDGPIYDSGVGPVTDSAGRPMDFDLSGIRASAAITVHFGGHGGF